MIIVASKSPRRKELLLSMIKEFVIIPPHIDEFLYPFEELSLAKAKSISASYPNDIIISADTLVIKNDKVYGKPKDKKEAFAMLKELSNSVHEVKTIYSIYRSSPKIEVTRIITSKVYFNNLSDELITRYVDTLSPLDKAGGYGIQDKDFHLVDHIEGSYSNIVGLPIEELKKDLINLKIIA